MKRGVQMRKLLLGSVALIVMSAPVLAADMPVKVKPLPPVWSWTGCYVGLNVGYTWARFRKSEVREFDAGGAVFVYNDFSFDDDGASGGVQIGCNWQNGVIVWGVEADIQVTSVEARNVFDNAIFNVAPAAFDTEVTSALRWFGTARGRLGWTVTPTTLLYVTGGLAYGLDRSSLHFRTAAGAPTTFFGSDSQTHFGYTVGFGGEAKITQNFSAKLEYLYTDLGGHDYNFINIAGDNYRWHQRVDFHTVRLGLNYQFNWYETVVAKY
jgi:outer membrane immunogenic protein